MKLFLKYEKWITLVFFFGIFLLSIIPLRDPDIWFHLKSGEVIAQKGIIHYDVFSYTAAGREWYPYEWLFQISTYYFKQVFGFEALKYLVAIIITLQVSLMYLLLRKILNLSVLLTYILTFFYFTSIYEFLTARPHVVAYTMLLANLLLILLYYFRNKNYLWLSIPVTLIWTNLHGSIFLDIGFFFAYSLICLANFFLYHNKTWLQKAKILFGFTILSGILTILPPLGFTQYRLLVYFYQQRDFISKFIDEWSPLDTDPTIFVYLTILAFASSIVFIFVVIKTKRYKENIWVLPLLPFLYLMYVASRNVYLSYITITILFALSLRHFTFTKHKNWIRILFVTGLMIFTGWNIILLLQKRIPERMYYPVNATNFIKVYNLQGNMFNEYGYGGYMLYQLYPGHKVFYDGRTDVYLCCEMPATLDLAVYKNKPDNEYKKILDAFWDKFHISYVIMRSQKHSVLRKIARILTDDSDWSLVFWDDDSQIFVLKDGKNDNIIKEFGAQAATPYNQDPYRKGQQQQALKEYERMIKIVDSARSRNAIGYILLQNKQWDAAMEQFGRAVQLDPTFESPYMNLAELAAKDNYLNEAIRLYEVANKLAPDRGLIYIRLGQLYLQRDGDLEKAESIWQKGIKTTVDEDAKKKLMQLVNQ